MSGLTAKAYVTRNVRIRGGEPVQFARSLKRCWKVCLSLVECSGFDFIASREASLDDTQCFLHGQQTICNRHEHLPGSDNYRLHMCGASCRTQRHVKATVSLLLYHQNKSILCQILNKLQLFRWLLPLVVVAHLNGMLLAVSSESVSGYCSQYTVQFITTSRTG